MVGKSLELNNLSWQRRLFALSSDRGKVWATICYWVQSCPGKSQMSIFFFYHCWTTVCWDPEILLPWQRDVTTSLKKEEKCEVTLPWQQSLWITTIGSLSNDAVDGKENWKNAIGLYTQNNNSARAPRFFVRFLAVVAWLLRETS